MCQSVVHISCHKQCAPTINGKGLHCAEEVQRLQSHHLCVVLMISYAVTHMAGQHCPGPDPNPEPERDLHHRNLDLNLAVACRAGKSQWLFLLYESFFFIAFFCLAFLALQFKNHSKR